MSQGYCWPSLGEPCGECHRCAPDPDPLQPYYDDPKGQALVQAILDRKAASGA